MGQKAYGKYMEFAHCLKSSCLTNRQAASYPALGYSSIQCRLSLYPQTMPLSAHCSFLIALASIDGGVTNALNQRLTPLRGYSSRRDTEAQRLLYVIAHNDTTCSVGAVREVTNFSSSPRLGEFKKLDSFKQINARLNDAEDKRASTVCIEVPTTNRTIAETETAIKKWFNSPQKKVNYVDTVLLIWDKMVIPIIK